MQAPTAAPDRVEWAHCKRPLPKHVYDAYMKHWRDKRFAIC